MRRMGRGRSEEKEERKEGKGQREVKGEGDTGGNSGDKRVSTERKTKEQKTLHLKENERRKKGR